MLDRDEAAARHVARFPPSSQRLILEWIAAAKRPETRRRRITRTVQLAARNLRAAHPGVRLTRQRERPAGGERRVGPRRAGRWPNATELRLRWTSPRGGVIL